MGPPPSALHPTARIPVLPHAAGSQSSPHEPACGRPLTHASISSMAQQAKQPEQSQKSADQGPCASMSADAAALGQNGLHLQARLLSPGGESMQAASPTVGPGNRAPSAPHSARHLTDVLDPDQPPASSAHPEQEPRRAANSWHPAGALTMSAHAEHGHASSHAHPQSKPDQPSAARQAASSDKSYGLLQSDRAAWTPKLPPRGSALPASAAATPRVLKGSESGSGGRWGLVSPGSVGVGSSWASTPIAARPSIRNAAASAAGQPFTRIDLITSSLCTIPMVVDHAPQSADVSHGMYCRTPRLQPGHVQQTL